MILEIVQGEGGVIPAPTDFLQGVRRVTRELDIPLIVDEIQCGCGRSGRWFAFEQHGIVPDVIVASKALGGLGMPIAMILYDEQLGPLGARCAHRHLPRQPARVRRRRDRDPDHPARRHPRANVREMGASRWRRYEGSWTISRSSAEARGSGLMLGLELVDPSTRSPERDGRAARRNAAALERGLIVELGGRDDAVVRLLPPLNVTRQTLDQALEILREALELASADR